MQLDHNIILAGDQPQVGNALAAGLNAGVGLGQSINRGELRGVVQEHGANAMRGDETALSQIAAYDPSMAQGLMAGVQQMRVLDQTTAAELATKAAALSKAERDAQAAQHERIAKLMHGFNSAEEWDAYAAQHAPDMVGEWGNRDAYIGQFLDAADILKGGQTEAFRTLEQRAQAAGLKAGTPAYVDFMTKGAGGGITINNGGPDGGKFSEETAKHIAGQFAEFSETGAAAQRSEPVLAQLEGLLAQSPQGFMAYLQGNAQKFGVTLTEGAGALQAADAIINKLIPEQRPAGSGSMSDGDVAMFRASLPSVLGTPEGNALILGRMRAMAEYDKEIGRLAEMAIYGIPDEKGEPMTPAKARAAMMALPNPLANWRETSAQFSKANPKGGAGVQEVTSAQPAAGGAGRFANMSNVQLNAFTEADLMAMSDEEFDAYERAILAIGSN